MNFYYQEVPVSANSNTFGFTKIDMAYTRLEDLFMYLNFPDRSMLDKLKDYFVPAIVPKRTKLIDTRTITDKIYFIAKGAVRVYIVDDKKQEQTQLLLTEGSLTTCLKGFLDKKEAECNIVTTEDSVLLSITNEKFNLMLKELYGSLNVFTTALSKKILFQQELSKVLKTDTKHKFEYLQTKLADAYNRFALKYQASFLGIKPETLSRVRGVKKAYM